MRCTISGFKFFMPSGGGYIRLESDTKCGTLALQICEGGGFRGATVLSSPATFERDCKKWVRQNKRNAALIIT